MNGGKDVLPGKYCPLWVNLSIVMGGLFSIVCVLFPSLVMTVQRFSMRSKVGCKSFQGKQLKMKRDDR